MSFRPAIRLLVALALGLPLALAALLGIARGLLAALGDERGTAVIDAVGQAISVCWLLSLVGLVVVLGLHALQQAPPED